MPLMRRESFHRAEIFIRLRHLITRDAGVMFPLQALKHPPVTHLNRRPPNPFQNT